MNDPTLRYIIEQLNDTLQKTDSEGNDLILKTEKAVGICSKALLELREFVNHSNFKNTMEEIRFFKEIKPFVLGEYLYHSKLLEILIRQPVTTIKSRKKYLRQIIAEAQQLFKDNPEFYHYYRSGSTYLDDKYFVRTEISCTINCHQFIFDPFFSTSHDYLLAAIKTNERIADYCKAQIRQLKTKINNDIIRTNLRWTERKRALLEVIYAIHSSGAVNNGTADIKELVEAFESIFNIKLPRFYHTFFEMVQRKKLRTPYLDLMKESLLKRMENSDEN